MNASRRKKGITVSDLPSVAVTFIIVAAVFAAGFLVVTGLQATQGGSIAGCNSTNTSGCNAAYWAAGNLTSGLAGIVNNAPTWGTVLGVAVLLGVVLAVFGFAYSRGYI